MIMIELLTIVGARPQFIKASAIHRAIKNKYSDKIRETIVHTGQHYDERLSDVFFKEMELPEPDLNLNAGSASHARQTAHMIEGVERVINSLEPDMVLVYGDTNSTMAGALAASKMHIPVIHVEAGLRSRNKKTPEEINRVVTDHVSSLLCAPTLIGFNNLVKEGFNAYADPPFSISNPILLNSGDVMLDNALYYGELAKTKENLLAEYGLEPDKFAVLTLHRDFNTDNPDRLFKHIATVKQFSEKFDLKVIFPIHPRTQNAIDEHPNAELKKMLEGGNIITTPPASYLEMLMYLQNATIVLSDSGGLQKEAFFFKKPALVLRNETEWYELVKQGNSVVCGEDSQRLLDAAEHYLRLKPALKFPPLYGTGVAAETICDEIIRYFEEK